MEVFTVLLTIIICLLMILIVNQMTYWPRKGIPHCPTMPVIGNRFVLSFLGGPTMAEYSIDIYNKYHPHAKYIGLMMINTPIIILKDPELIKDIFVKNFDSCTDHKSFIDERLDPILGKNILSLCGDRWREVRSALSPSFTASKMKFLFELVSKVSQDFVRHLEDHPELTDKVIDTKDVFSRYTNDVIATSAFGISVNSMKERENEFYLRGKDATSLTGTKKILKFMAGMLFPRIMRFAGYTYLSKDTNDFFLDLIKQTVKLRDENPSAMRPDLIHLLLQARDSPGVKMDINDIIAQAFIFFFGGFETSSTVMSLICLELAHHQDVQHRLHKEIDDVMNNNDILSYESITKMKYLDMVIQEVLRLYPPVFILDRVCVKSIDLPPSTPQSSKLTVTPGSIFWVLAYAMQRDPKYFPNPDAFDPERFSDANKDNIVNYTFSPFGIGPRKCIAERFALMEIKLLLTRLLHRFIIKPTANSTRKIIIDRNNVTLFPKGGVWLKFEKR